MTKAGKRILAGIAEARAVVRGEREPARTVSGGELVKRIRERENLTQAEFARMFQISIGAVRDWEQGRRTPDGPAQVLLRVIASDPQAVRRALENG